MSGPDRISNTDQRWKWARAAVRRFSRLDDRSLAAMRIGLGCVLLLDIRRGWILADDWLALQGYDQWPLPLVVGDAETSLRLALVLFGLASFAFLIGWRTRITTPLVWLAACGYQYASRHTVDYHDAVVCQLLLWSVVLPLSRRWSVDAWQGRVERVWPDWLSRAAATGLLATIAWIYLTTFVVKDGAAWWVEGHAVRLAIADRAAMREVGAWCAQHLPGVVFAVLSWVTLAIELAVPILLFSGRVGARRVAAAGLWILHGGMWLLMDLGTFPLTMMAAATALWLPVPKPSTATPIAMSPIGGALVGFDPGRWLPRMIALLFSLNLLLAADDERQRRWPVDPDTTLARWLRRGHTFLAAEPVWWMYAPEPWRFTGWWVAVGETAGGELIDPITGQRPHLLPPVPGASMLRWAYLGNPPSITGPIRVTVPAAESVNPAADAPYGMADAYERFLLRQDRRQPPDRRLQWLALVYVYEALDGPERSTQRPLLSRVWPDTVSAGRVARALGAQLYHVNADSLGVPGWRPTPIKLSSSRP